jgi:hypothetical protein
VIASVLISLPLYLILCGLGAVHFPVSRSHYAKLFVVLQPISGHFFAWQRPVGQDGRRCAPGSGVDVARRAVREGGMQKSMRRAGAVSAQSSVIR